MLYIVPKYILRWSRKRSDTLVHSLCEVRFLAPKGTGERSRSFVSGPTTSSLTLGVTDIAFDLVSWTLICYKSQPNLSFRLRVLLMT